jgi:hypothetical protein
VRWGALGEISRECGQGCVGVLRSVVVTETFRTKTSFNKRVVLDDPTAFILYC